MSLLVLNQPSLETAITYQLVKNPHANQNYGCPAWSSIGYTATCRIIPMALEYGHIRSSRQHTYLQPSLFTSY
jgi:hypothetical protein